MFFSVCFRQKIKAIIPYIAFSLALIFFSISMSFPFFSSNYYFAGADNSKGLIILDAGHGGEDVGAIGVSGVYEKDLNLTFTFIMKEQLESAGYAVVLTRSDDKLLYTEEENIKGMRKIYDLKNRIKIANQYENAVFVSVHMNSFGDSKYSGLQVYYGKAEGSEALANTVQDEVVKKIQPGNNRKIKNGSELYLMENSINPAILVECGFLSNKDECEKLSEKEYQKELSFAIICGIIKYIDMTD